MLIQHSNASAGLLAWRGIIAAATVFAEHAHAMAPQASSSSLTHSSQLTASTDAAAGFGDSPDSRQNPVSSSEASAGRFSPLLTVMPAVMAYYSCNTGSAAQAIMPSMAQQSNKELESHSLPVLKLLRAEARLYAPFIAALIAHCEQSLGQLGLSRDRHDLSTRHDVVQPLDEALTVDGSMPVGSLKAVHEACGNTDGMNSCCSDRLVAAIEILLAMSEEQTLLAHTLRLVQQLHEACSSFRYAGEPP